MRWIIILLIAWWMFGCTQIDPNCPDDVSNVFFDNIDSPESFKQYGLFQSSNPIYLSSETKDILGYDLSPIYDWNNLISDKFFYESDLEDEALMRVNVVSSMEGGKLGEAQWMGIEYCRINLLDSLDTKTSRRILVHEIGHCLGFKHSSQKCSVMYKDSIEGQQFTNAIVETSVVLFSNI